MENAVVLLNAPVERCREFLNQANASGVLVYSHSDLEEAVDWLVNTLCGPVSSTIGIIPITSPCSTITQSILGAFDDPVTESRHGWIGTAKRFIQDVRNHKLLSSFMSEKRRSKGPSCFFKRTSLCLATHVACG